MCGFVVLAARGAGTVAAGPLAQATELLAHRGPDDAGQFLEDGVGIGFRRLSILDLSSSGHQPMVSADGRYVLAYNGEIFNYTELRSELLALGHRFRSTGDTEVLLASYVQWGSACLERLNGMWAFVVYDRQSKSLFGARDRFGIKPLYWYADAQSLVFASEIKAIRAARPTGLATNKDVLAAFLLDRVLDSDDQTFYAGVRQAPAGCCFQADPNGNLTWHRYWSVSEAAQQVALPADPAGAFGDLFEDAVRLTMRSDVPVGVLLSGGLDSSSIICSMARHRTANRGDRPLGALCYMDASFDETRFIDATLAQTGASLLPLDVSPAQMWQTLERMIWHQDEPVHSINAVIGYHLMRMARANGMEVVLNGQGADETLAGYSSYFRSYWIELLRTGGLATLHRSVTSVGRDVRGAVHGYSGIAQWCIRRILRQAPFYRTLSRSRRRAHVRRTSWVSPDVVSGWTPREYADETGLDASLRFSLERSHLPVYLRVEDRNSMAHGVEQRLPFLDHRLVALAFRLGAEWKLRGRETKVILRESMRGRIPEIVRTRMEKYGFPTSVDTWFRGPLYDPLRDLVASRSIRESGIWNMAAIEQALERHRRGEINVGDELFDVVQVGLWQSLARGAGHAASAGRTPLARVSPPTRSAAATGR